MANLYFPDFIDLDDLTDQYEDYLFEYKQFFISRFPVDKVFEAKISKLRKIDSAFISLGGELPDKTVDSSQLTLKTTTDLFELFNNYQSFKSTISNSIQSAKTINQLIRYVELWCAQVNIYAGFWQITNFDRKDIIVSKSPDEMNLLKCFKSLKESVGLIDIKVVSNLPEANPLYREAIRLSLLSKL